MSLPSWTFDPRTWVAAGAILAIVWGVCAAFDFRGSSPPAPDGPSDPQRVSPAPRAGAVAGSTIVTDYAARYGAAVRKHGQAAVDADRHLI